MWSVLCLLCSPRGKLSWGIICQSCDPVLSVFVRGGHGRHANRWRCGESGGLWWRILGGMPISDIHRFRPTFILAGYVDGLQGKLKRIWSGKQETWIPLYDTLYESFQRLKPFPCPPPSKDCSKKYKLGNCERVYIRSCFSWSRLFGGQSLWGQISFGTFGRHRSNTRTDSPDKRDKRLEGRAGGGIDTTGDRDPIFISVLTFFFNLS